MKSAVKRDVVVVIPCIPAAPPRLDASQDAQQSWLQHCHAFSAITSLAGCPSVVLPTGALLDGAPLGLAMFGQARTDQRLLAVAHKLTPHIQVCSSCRAYDVCMLQARGSQAVTAQCWCLEVGVPDMLSSMSRLPISRSCNEIVVYVDARHSGFALISESFLLHCVLAD